MADTIEKIGAAKIQYGPFNNRIYLMKYSEADAGRLLDRVMELWEENNFRKIFAKAPSAAHDRFASAGFEREALSRGLYRGEDDAEFWAIFRDEPSQVDSNPSLLSQIRETALAKETLPEIQPLPSGYTFRQVYAADADELARLYDLVFDSYPFPIQDPAYLRQTMEENFVYFGVWKGSELVAASSCEIDDDALAVEMTDFATNPEYRGLGLATHLLFLMEDPMRVRGIKTGFTIARAHSFGMNCTFSKVGYEFGGTLINNTNIGGQIESMNVWTKPL